MMRLIDAYGADPSRWPETERADAEALLEACGPDAEALKALLADAGALDALLESAPRPAAATAAFMTRLEDIPSAAAKVGAGRPGGVSRLSAVRPRPAALPGWLFGRGMLAQAAGLAMAGALGVMLGLSGLARPDGSAAGTYEVLDASEYVLGDPGLMRDLEEVE